MAAKISSAMITALTDALADPNREVTARTVTRRALVNRGLAQHERLSVTYPDHTHGFVLTEAGIAEAQRHVKGPKVEDAPNLADGTYYPNEPGARTIREARPLYVGNERVRVDVDNGAVTLFYGLRIMFQGPIPAGVTTTAALYEWAQVYIPVEVTAMRYERRTGGDGTSEFHSTVEYAVHVRQEIKSAQRRGIPVTAHTNGLITIDGERKVRFLPLPEEDTDTDPEGPQGDSKEPEGPITPADSFETDGDGWIATPSPIPGVVSEGAYKIPGEVIAEHVEPSGWGGDYHTYRVQVTEDVPRILVPGDGRKAGAEYRKGEILTVHKHGFAAIPAQPSEDASEPQSDREPYVYTIDAAQLAATRAKIEKINERAARKGLSGHLTMNVEEVEVTETDEDTGFSITTTMYEVTLGGTAPRHNGWQFIATLDWDENAGLIVRTAPGIETVNREGLKEGWCGHCNKSRSRRVTYLVRNEKTGQEVQVGRSCIKDFIGWAGTISWLEKPNSRDTEWFGAPALREVSPESVLAIAWACVKIFGFVRSRDEGSTASKVHTVINPHPKSEKSKRFAREMRPLAEEAQVKAREILAWILSDEFFGYSEYVTNLKAIASGKRVSLSYVGLMASAVQAWARYNEQTLIRKSQESSKHIGAVKERREFTGTVDSVRWIEGFRGTIALYMIRTDDGNLIKWFSSNAGFGEDKGFRVTFKATIKKHEEYKGVKSTVVTRAVLISTNHPTLMADAA